MKKLVLLALIILSLSMYSASAENIEHIVGHWQDDSGLLQLIVESDGSWSLLSDTQNVTGTSYTDNHLYFKSNSGSVSMVQYIGDYLIVDNTLFERYREPPAHNKSSPSVNTPLTLPTLIEVLGMESSWDQTQRWKYALLDNKEAIIVDMDNYSSFLEYPEKVDSYPVVAVSFGSFSSDIERVKFPASVRYIYPSVCGFYEVQEYIVDKNNQYYISIDGMIMDKSMNSLILAPFMPSLLNALPPSVNRIVSGSCSWLSSIDNIRIPSGIQTLEIDAFHPGLVDELYIPSSVTSIISNQCFFLEDHIRQTHFIVEENSYAEYWAQENNASYTVRVTSYSDTPSEVEDSTLNLSEAPTNLPTISFSASNSIAKPNSAAEAILGTWHVPYRFVYSNYTFNEDGTGIEVFHDEDDSITYNTFTYTVSENVITLSIDGGFAGWGDRLIFENENWNMLRYEDDFFHMSYGYWERKSDSVIPATQESLSPDEMQQATDVQQTMDADDSSEQIVETQPADTLTPTLRLRIGSTYYDDGDTYGVLTSGDFLFLTAEFANAKRLYIRVYDPSTGESIVDHTFDDTVTGTSVSYHPVIKDDIASGTYVVEATVSNSDIRNDPWAQKTTCEFLLKINRDLGFDTQCNLSNSTIVDPHNNGFLSNRFILFGKNSPITEGYIRFVSQMPIYKEGTATLPAVFYADQWKYEDYDRSSKAKESCSYASLSMQLSYLGIDCSPGKMFYILQEKEFNRQTIIDYLIENENVKIDAKRIGLSTNDMSLADLQKMLYDYENDTNYAPVLMFMEYGSKWENTHAVLIIGRSDGKYYIANPETRTGMGSFEINVRDGIMYIENATSSKYNGRRISTIAQIWKTN